ncbi:hypothetical protein [Helicobacter vulpis]|uniref:hypothetical protein n=1 Tax=Helicobacter vulpis TaxID=2316076 RepID=UPI000EAE0811|nr:hypothetical protein [Helicobacter vulpis]
MLDFSTENGKENLEKFVQHAELTVGILDIFLKKTETKDPGLFHLGLFQRTLLCFGDYSIEATNQFFSNLFKPGLFRFRELVFKLFRKNLMMRVSPISKDFWTIFCHLQKEELPKRIQDIVENYTKSQGVYLSQISCPLIQRSWWKQLLLQQEELFEFINVANWGNSDRVQECGRIKFERDCKNKLQKVYLLQAKKDSGQVRDILGYAFYCYCKQYEKSEQNGEKIEGLEIMKIIGRVANLVLSLALRNLLFLQIVKSPALLSQKQKTMQRVINRSIHLILISVRIRMF